MGDAHQEQPTVMIERVVDVTPVLVDAFRHLLPQLSTSAPALTAQDLEDIVQSPATVLLIARDSRDNGRIIGTATLVVFRIPSGRRARIESVVVDSAARGRGAGGALCQAAIAEATAAGATAVDLTSGTSREPAARLYERLGFERRETNVFRWSAPWPPP